MGVRDGLPVRPTKIPDSRPRVAEKLGRLRRRGRQAPERGVRGEDPGRHGHKASGQKVALPARRPQEWIQQRDDALQGPRRENVLPGGATPSSPLASVSSRADGMGTPELPSRPTRRSSPAAFWDARHTRGTPHPTRPKGDPPGRRCSRVWSQQPSRKSMDSRWR